MSRGQLQLTLSGGSVGGASLQALELHEDSHNVTRCHRLAHLLSCIVKLGLRAMFSSVGTGSLLAAGSGSVAVVGSGECSVQRCGKDWLGSGSWVGLVNSSSVVSMVNGDPHSPAPTPQKWQNPLGFAGRRSLHRSLRLIKYTERAVRVVRKAHQI